VTRKAEYVFRNAGIDLRKQCGRLVRNCVRKMRQHGCSPLLPGNDYDAAVEALASYFEDELTALFNRYRKHKSNYEPLFSMPPPRRKPAVAAKPLTLVERRAVAAKAKVMQWQRKQKLAATKVRQYRKKVSYYTKKGVIR